MAVPVANNAKAWEWAWAKATNPVTDSAKAPAKDTNTYETQVRGQVKKGKAVISGFADGPNRKGISREDVKRAIESSISEESDPLENQQLPRTEREHAMDYFNKLRAGK